MALPPGFPPGSHPWLMVRVVYYVDFCFTTWQVPGEMVEIGFSRPFQLDPAGPGLGDGTPASPAPLLDGLQPFRLESSKNDSAPWFGTPMVVGTNVVLYWGGARTVLRESFLERSSRPDGPWLVVTNARSPHMEPYDSVAASFFRAVTVRRATGTNNQSAEAARPALSPQDDE
jgi:hypothetical protein